MNQDKKLSLISQVNELLENLNKTVDTNDEIKNLIKDTYNKINQPEKVTQQYNQIADAVSEMNYAFQDIALKKKYHFSSEQNDIINKLKSVSRESMWQKGIGTINGAVW